MSYFTFLAGKTFPPEFTLDMFLGLEDETSTLSLKYPMDFLLVIALMEKVMLTHVISTKTLDDV